MAGSLLKTMLNGKFNTFEDENRRLFDLLFRHQVYLEGVKSGFSGNYNLMLRELYKLFAAYMGRSRYQTLDNYTRLELANFVRLFQLAQQRFYSHYTQEMINLLKQFLAVDVELTRGIFHSVTDQHTQQVAKTAVAANDENSDDVLWSRITNAPIPANGLTMEDSLNAFAQSTTNAVVNEINKGYANKSTTLFVLNKIVGKPENRFADGLFARFNNQNTQLIATLLQHVSSIQQSSIGSVYYKRYQWVAILDSRTTEICTSRNGLVYIYGEGPLPPAHYGCRSKDVALAGDETIHDVPTNFFDWLSTQSDTYLEDALGLALTKQVKNGDFTNANFSAIGTMRPLTLDQFAKKLPYILGD